MGLENVNEVFLVQKEFIGEHDLRVLQTRDSRAQGSTAVHIVKCSLRALSIQYQWV